MSREEILANKITPVFFEAVKEYIRTSEIFLNYEEKEREDILSEFFTEEKAKELSKEFITGIKEALHEI